MVYTCSTSAVELALFKVSKDLTNGGSGCELLGEI